jgi:RNA polymerase sigma factor (TIGR02999 family)
MHGLEVSGKAHATGGTKGQGRLAPNAPLARPVDLLLPTLYDELRALANQQLKAERSSHTIQPTALVHEVYLKLAQQQLVPWDSPAHFLALAAQAMRRILVDYARAQLRHKRGDGVKPVTLSGARDMVANEPIDVMDLDQALRRLTDLEPAASRVVEMKFFGGLTEPEIAEVLSLSERTIRRHWNYARAWLYRELGDPASEGAGS